MAAQGLGMGVEVGTVNVDPYNEGLSPQAVRVEPVH